MSTIPEANVAAAEAYYKGFVDKDPTAIARHLHPEVQFLSPMGQSTGREAVVEAAMKLAAIIKTFKVRGRFGAGDQVMLAYDLGCNDPIGTVRAAVLMSFRDGLIASIELFFDPRPFTK